jgi:copper(I)-binding protein
MTIRRQLPVLAFLLALLAAASASAELVISQPWVREAPPTARVMAGYMNISNAGTTAVNVIAVSSPDFAKTELHRTVVEDGVARMEPVGQLEIAAGTNVTLEPGGLHLMLIEPEQALQDGDSVKLVIHRADGICMTVDAPVQRDTSAGDAHSQHHHHH